MTVHANVDALALALPIRRSTRVADTLRAAAPFAMEMAGGSCCCVVTFSEMEAVRVSLETVRVRW